MVRPLLFLTLLFCVSSDCSPYDYQDFSTWPDLCKNGSNQSPVNVVSAQAKPFTHFSFPVYLPWTKLSATFCDCCFYNVTLSPAGSLIVKDFDGQSLVYKPSYMLVHTPSEHTLDGAHYDVEVQIYHSVFSGNTPLTTAAVSLFFNGGAETDSEFFQQFVDTVGKELDVSLATFTLQSVITQSAVFWDYYIYQGSVTAPPCTENVLWVLFFSGVQSLSNEQLSVLTDIWEPIPPKGNNRPAQELGSRRVYHKSKF